MLLMLGPTPIPMLPVPRAIHANNTNAAGAGGSGSQLLFRIAAQTTALGAWETQKCHPHACSVPVMRFNCISVEICSQSSEPKICIKLFFR